MKDYLDITVVISPGPEGRYAVRVSCESGQGNSILKLPFTLSELSTAVFGVSETARNIGARPPAAGGSAATDPRSAADFGVELFEALFQGEARDLLVATESRAQSSLDTGVRIRVSMDLQGAGMAEVASLPWELMCRKGQRALAVSTQTPLVRSLDSPQPTDARPFHPPLRILAMMSNPTGTGALNLDQERAQIEQDWAKLPGVQVDFVRPVQADILYKLAGGDYHVIHYMGHGDFDAGEGGMLLLEDKNGNPHSVTGDVFAAWLADEPLRLVFLNACKTGTTSARTGVHPFAGVATALIRQRVPAVVAMQFPISDPAAIAFAHTFYERIAQGLPVDAAVAEGRKVLYSSNQAEWATPVLYLRSKDGRLFGPASDTPAPVSAVAGSQAQPVAAAAAPAAEDPWGPDTGSGFRVLLATPDQDREKLHGQIFKALQGIDGVRVVTAVPVDDETHEKVVDGLVRRADLCVHLLSANPGKRLDVDDGQPLRTYPLVQLEIGLRAANSQLVVITSEDKESIANAEYAKRVADLATLPRGKARFELVITEKNQIADAVKAKLEELKRARHAALVPSASLGTVTTAFVDSHEVDEESASDLVTFLGERNVDAFMQSSDSLAANELAQFGDKLKEFPLYILVAGKADEAWVKNRTNAARTSAVKSRAAILIGRYESANDPKVAMSRLRIIAALKRPAPDSVDSLFGPAARPPA
ncbi:MAG: CHAT domain-containing protein [Gemmatimonadales bacterium]